MIGKCKILLFAPNSPVSGVTNMVYNLHSKFDKSKFTISIISKKDNHLLRKLTEETYGTFFDFDIFFLKHPIKYISKLKNILYSDDYTTVIFNLSYLATNIPFYIAKKAKIPRIICYAHSSNIEASTKIKRVLLKWIHIFNRSHLDSKIVKIACSHKAAEWMYGNNQKVTIIENAINTERFKYNLEQRNIFREKYCSKPIFIVGNIGRLSYPKNQSFLIDTFYLVSQRDPSAVLWIVGEGPLRNILEKKIHRYALEEKVILWGNRNDVNNIISAFDLFVMPSIFEGAPVSAIEAQANGLPCLLSTSISNECIINSNVSIEDIAVGPEKWADLIINGKELKREENAVLRLNNKGWSLQNASTQLQKIYLQ